jgi:hypothetical protein
MRNFSGERTRPACSLWHPRRRPVQRHAKRHSFRKGLRLRRIGTKCRAGRTAQHARARALPMLSVRTPSSLVPKLHFGTHLSRQFHCQNRVACPSDREMRTHSRRNGVAQTSPFRNGVAERGEPFHPVRTPFLRGTRTAWSQRRTFSGNPRTFRPRQRTFRRVQCTRRLAQCTHPNGARTPTQKPRTFSKGTPPFSSGTRLPPPAQPTFTEKTP